MRVVVPILNYEFCECPQESWLIYMDDYGVTGIACPVHGPAERFDKLEFDSREDYEAWKAKQ